MDKHFLSCSIKKLKEEENPQKLMQEKQWHHSEREEEESDTRTSAPKGKKKTLKLRVRKVTQLGGQNGQFRYKRASNT